MSCEAAFDNWLPKGNENARSVLFPFFRMGWDQMKDSLITDAYKAGMEAFSKECTNNEDKS